MHKPTFKNLISSCLSGTLVALVWTTEKKVNIPTQCNAVLQCVVVGSTKHQI